MFGWFKRKEAPKSSVDVAALEKIDALAARVSGIENAKSELEEENKTLKEELKLLREQSASNQSKRDSNEPWIEIMSEGIDPVRGIIIGLDWNDAMIQYLKENGITGTTDEDVIRKYVAYLYEDLVQKLEFKVQQQASHKGKITDFE